MFKRTGNGDGFGNKQAKGRDSIEVSELRNAVNPASLDFLSTSELDPLTGLLGQERGMDAVALGAHVRADKFNIFAVGPLGAGKLTAVHNLLKEVVPKWDTPSDWVYVNNFRQPHRPLAMELSSGQGPQFSSLMIGLVDELRVGLPALFDSEEYTARRRVIDLSFESDQEDAIDNLVDLALSKDIQLVRTASGFTMVPMEDGEILEPEEFAGKPISERRVVEAKIKDLERQLTEILERLPVQQKERAEKLQSLNEDLAKTAVQASLTRVRAAFPTHKNILSYLDEVETDLIRHVGLFMGEETSNVMVRGNISSEDDPQFRRYMVNVLVTSGQAKGLSGEAQTGAPIIKEMNPTLSNLVGSVETLSEMGMVNTDFTLIKAGALHLANGGVLLLDARKLLQNDYAWEGLKRALLSRTVRIDSPIDDGTVYRPISLNPEPIPLNVKVVLFGDSDLYHRLNDGDPEFAQIFKIQAEFDELIDRTPESEIAYARLVAAVVARQKLKPVDVVGVARLIEQSIRQSGDSEKIQINFVTLQDILHEADYWAGQAGRKSTTHEDISKTLKLRDERASHLKRKLKEDVLRDIQMVGTEGAVTGQINGLSVLDQGNFTFGRPNRITARVRMGAGRVVDIEREVELGGPLHSKGVMILWGYLAGTYARDMPLSLSASLVFEQSYGGVDGDSASAAELFALLSALSQIPIKQGIAVTGSINQHGDMQAIGGVNEKIEGFFDLCKERGLTGSQGVIIPHSNRVHLMLREDVVAACGRGKFHVYAINHVNEGLEILTGVSAGNPSKSGSFPRGSVNRAVEERLIEMANMRRDYNEPDF